MTLPFSTSWRGMPLKQSLLGVESSSSIPCWLGESTLNPMCSQKPRELLTTSKIGEQIRLSSLQKGTPSLASIYGSKNSRWQARNHSSQNVRHSEPSLCPVPTSASHAVQCARLVTARQSGLTRGLAAYLSYEIFSRIGWTSLAPQQVRPACS